jgi:hypothetical protein
MPLIATARSAEAEDLGDLVRRRVADNFDAVEAEVCPPRLARKPGREFTAERLDDVPRVLDAAADERAEVQIAKASGYGVRRYAVNP